MHTAVRLVSSGRANPNGTSTVHWCAQSGVVSTCPVAQRCGPRTQPNEPQTSRGVTLKLHRYLYSARMMARSGSFDRTWDNTCAATGASTLNPLASLSHEPNTQLLLLNNYANNNIDSSQQGSSKWQRTRLARAHSRKNEAKSQWLVHGYTQSHAQA